MWTQLKLHLGVALLTLASQCGSSWANSCYLFPGQTIGSGSIAHLWVSDAAGCCSQCSSRTSCLAWTFHKNREPENSSFAGNCFLKDNAEPLVPPRKVDPANKTLSGLTGVAPTCVPKQTPVELCPGGIPCPDCGTTTRCSCYAPHESDQAPGFACLADGPGSHLPFCDHTLPVETRVIDLIKRINNTDKAALLTARGPTTNGVRHLRGIPALGVPSYYWGENCLHSIQDKDKSCYVDSHNVSRCPSTFPSGPSFAATFDRAIIQQAANVIGVELRALYLMSDGTSKSLDCWGPVIDMNRDPRWGRNGEGGCEDAYAMGELAIAWAAGFQAPRPSLLQVDGSHARELLQGVLTIKHMALNSIENTAPWTRHNFDANASFGVDDFVLADYYLKPFKAAIRGLNGNSGARGIMCSYNAVQGKPTCLSPLMRNVREEAGFKGYVTSDSDSVANAYNCIGKPEHPWEPRVTGHCYPGGSTATAAQATALALIDGQCDINSGDTYSQNIEQAVRNGTEGLTMEDVDRALFNSLKQRFDLGLFDPKEAYDWPTRDSIGTDASLELTLRMAQESLVLLRNDAQLLPLRTGSKIAVLGPHADAKKVMFDAGRNNNAVPICPNETLDCVLSPFAAISQLNTGGSTSTAPGCDLFLPANNSHNFTAALQLAREAEYIVLGLGIEPCGLNPAHNINPHAKSPGHCYQGSLTTGYIPPADQHMEMEGHDRTSIDLPLPQKELVKALLSLNKPTVIFMMNAGAVAIDVDSIMSDEPRNEESSRGASAPLAIIEAFYPGKRGGEALAQGIMGKMNAWGRMPYTVYAANWTETAEMSMHDLRVAPGRTYRYHRNPLFSFGAGLSLTTFAVSAPNPAPPCLQLLRTNTAAAVCSVSVSVENTGTMDGDVVIMAYFRNTRSEQDWANRRARQGVRNLDGRELLTPQRQLFDFTRLHGVKAGGQHTITFNVTASSVAEVDEKSGDLVSAQGQYELLFDDGSGMTTGIVRMSASVTGHTVVLEPFPSKS